MLTLYTMPGSCAFASHLALEYAKADYRLAWLDFRRTEQRSAEYLKINPKGRVPALVTPRGVLTETPAILQYIAQTHPAAKLAPLDDPFALADMNAFNSYLCSTVHVAHAHKTRGNRWVDDPAAIEAMRRKVPETMTACFQTIETEFFRGPWVMGEAFSVSDIYLFTITGWLAGDSVDVARFPKVAAHHAQLSADARVQKVQAEVKAVA